MRGSAGTGWRAPSLFDEAAEETGYRGVPALAVDTHESGNSFSFDTRYKAALGEWALTADLNLFQTAIYDRIGLVGADSLPHPPVRRYAWSGIGRERSRGVELLTESRVGGLAIVFGYVYSDVVEESGGVLAEKLFTPAHFISGEITWEMPQVVRFGSDYRIESSQLLPLNPFAPESPAFAIIDLSVEGWLTRNLSVSLNSENLFDARQTNTMPLYLGNPGTINQELFNSDFVWGPVEGRVINLGMKWKM
jgi:outer membrane receptor protein involved in Fe transport